MGEDRLTELATGIRAEHEAVLGCAWDAVEHARKCGEFLQQAKRLIGHGAWMKGVEDNSALAPTTARGYIRVAKRWPEIESKRQRDAVLTLRDALRLIARTPKDQGRTDGGEKQEPAPAPEWTPYLATLKVELRMARVRISPAKLIEVLVQLGFRKSYIAQVLKGIKAEQDAATREGRIASGVA